MELFESGVKEGIPLAHRMRPQDWDGFVGQEHILGKGKILRRAIEADRITSLILYGPPGSGKTALAHLIAKKTHSHFVQLNAVTSGVVELRDALQRAKERGMAYGERTILFIDEIHRFNKAQQDALMPDVEDGTITLIGATVHNPYFSINSTLLSRSQIFTFNPLSKEEVKTIILNALRDKERGLGNFKVRLDREALDHLVTIADGDARRALNALEIGVLTTKPGKDGCIHYTLREAEESIQKKAIHYDRDEDGHYDTASAFIKSMRGSDPDAALYWLAKMILAGEDPRFIARRIIICAAEDVGNADPQALVVATSALQALEFIGLPEAKIPLAQATIYVATAPKSNACYEAISKAMEDVEERPTMEVPPHLRVGSYPGAERLGHGKGYKYPHDFPGHWVRQSYLPEKVKYYRPTGLGYEKRIKQWMEQMEMGSRKERIRREVLKRRSRLSDREVEGRSKEIGRRLSGLAEFKEAKMVMFYLSKDKEVRTEGMVRQWLKEGKKVVVPVVDLEERRLIPSLLLDYDGELAPGAFKILEPKREYLREVSPKDIELMIIPGVAFDERGNRLGFGGGYYDRFLKGVPSGVPRIGLGFELQIVEHLPAGEMDIPVDKVITERRVIDCT